MNINPNRLDYRGNILSQVTYNWIGKLFKKGFKTTLKQEDLFPCPREQLSENLYERFETHWKKELKEKRRPDIKLALAKTLKSQFIIAGIFYFIESSLLLILSLLVSQFASGFTQSTSNRNNNVTTVTAVQVGSSLGYAIAISLILVYLVFNHSMSNYHAQGNGIQLLTVCTSALFHKVIRLQQSTLHRTSIGHIINLISNDVYKLGFGVEYWNYLWISPILIILTVLATLVYIGPIGLVGVAYIVLHIPVQTVVGFLFGHFRYLQSLAADRRLEIMDQVIRGMRVIKFYVWENSFMQYINGIRKREIRYAGLAGFTQSLTFSLYNSSLFIALFLMYSLSIAINNPLTQSQLVFAYLILNKLRLDCVLYLGQAIFTWRESVLSLKRIQNILELPESIDSCLTHSPSSDNPSIEITNFSASWRGTELTNRNNLVLKRIYLTVDRANLVVIAGPIGSGKSSLLMSLINELPGMSGQININGISSYAAQQPWIFSGTFRDNILFGSTLHSQRYQQVIAACSLTDDIAAFEEGDMTLIGERGVTLSGGQKARVSLARVIYQKADIYLLDDPLSAVDMKVGRDIFDNCVRGFLSDKIVVMATHQLQYVKSADEVVVMREGTVVCKGVYESVVEDTFCREFLLDLERNEEREVSVIRNVSSTPYGTVNPTDNDLTANETEQTNDPLSRFLTAEDHMPNASSLGVYIQYFWTGGFFATVLMLVLAVASNCLLILSFWWMQSMSACTNEFSISPSDNVSNDTNQFCPWYLSVYYPAALEFLGFFTLFGFISSVLLCFTLYYVLLQASRRLHNRMLHRVMHSPMYFFDTNPSGRILNRFSTDIGFLDGRLPYIFCYFWTYAPYIIFATLASCVSQYYMLIPIAICLISTLSFRYYYLKTSSQLKRLESVSRSPLYSHISLSLLGLSTIRALRIEKRVTQDFHYFQDEHTASWYHYTVCTKWFEMRLGIFAFSLSIVGIVTAMVTYYILEWDQLVSFSLPLLISIPYIFEYVIRVSAEAEILMVSVDRVMAYCGLAKEKICSSPRPYQISSPNSSMSRGDIQFINMSFKYSADLPNSLTNVSLHVLAGEKIGIIGRTGAGKSSLFNALCRTNEISEGCVLIDRDDISKLDLYEHRKRLSVISQDPVLFSGTLRYNLDPFDEFSSEEIWAAVGNCNLRKMVESLPNQLMSPVEEDGHNFSVGERQLLCLARAILRKNRIILIDEATANVDIHTDTFVQQAIRTHFSECTVLTIAHRIETIIDSDRIIVLDKGRVIEFEVPLLMLENENSYLSRLLSQLDLITQIRLRDLAI